MKNFMVCLGLACITIFYSVSAFAYTLEAPDKFDFIDTQSRYASSDGVNKLASGICYGPVFEVKNGTTKIGEIGRVCLIGLVDIENASNEVNSGYAISLFNMMGMTFSIAQDPFRNDLMWGVGISLTDLYKQSLK